MWRHRKELLNQEARILFVCASLCNPKKKCVCEREREREREREQKKCPFTLAFVIPPFLSLAQGGPALARALSQSQAKKIQTSTAKPTET